MVEHFACNAAGRDFAVGDVHGCFRLLERELEKAGFDPHRDRLFSVGDLIDRGPRSEAALNWLDLPWFHAVRGNHEQMAIDVAAGRYDADNYRINGGTWFLRLSPARRSAIVGRLARLPIAIEVATRHGTVGFVHADIAGRTWAAFRDSLRDTQSDDGLRAVARTALWSRTRIAAGDTAGVPDLHRLVVGHTPVLDGVKTLGNVVFIDTGAVFPGGRLSLVELDAL
ncbi:metallophosphoesterase [Robbsia sp. Bb-Pol-6]|uniref:Metallophosphoesterase n=1 Tax=Robbsia betulipollinis TaxID=2981849 RepID=A0ABT3ZH91_9BURK|nr:metallophosphoesterase [Robbsia betulipollinis]MCY0385827.1 metallophosphoesterase [Robbsia betulipollinis]